jgi:hypothetical protein
MILHWARKLWRLLVAAFGPLLGYRRLRFRVFLLLVGKGSDTHEILVRQRRHERPQLALIDLLRMSAFCDDVVDSRSVFRRGVIINVNGEQTHTLKKTVTVNDRIEIFKLPNATGG